MRKRAVGHRCIFILSMKSCGSSVLQRHIVSLANARVARTCHAENETLYWSKAASVLDLPQIRMENSEVPLPKPKAAMMLARFVRKQAPGYEGSLDTEQDIFAAWTAVVRAQPKAFVEKSPHHLYQPAVLELMERYADQEASVDAHFIGLVRNPTDMVYSSWRRFGIVPEREEQHWIRSYGLLRALHERRPDLVSLIRYEDLVAGKVDMASILRVKPAKTSRERAQTFHSASINKWRRDSRFGYTPSEEARQLANSFGYADEEIVNPSARPWWVHRVPRAVAFVAFRQLPVPAQKRLKSAAKRILGMSSAGHRMHPGTPSPGKVSERAVRRTGVGSPRTATRQ